MYFDFEDHRPDTPTIGRSMSLREIVLITVNLHLLALVAILLGPKLPFVQAILERQQAARAEEQQQQKERDNARFVFMAPRVETRVEPPRRAELSDVDRRARTAERAPDPRNAMPFARGNSSERVEAAPPARGVPDAPTVPDPTPEPVTEAPPPPPLVDSPSGYARPVERQTARGPSAGVLSDAIRNVQKYAEKDGFRNLQGGQSQDFGPNISFDSKGVEFGPWLARFVAQVRRNWFIPMAAMTMHGNVVITFNIHKDGRITDVTVARPSSIDAFTLSARNAILASNPTVPLPPEYPDAKAFFTVTFFFNENPGAP